MNSKVYPSLNLFFAVLFSAGNLDFADVSIQASLLSSVNGSETDRLSLLAIKSQLQDPLGTLASWNSSLDHCIWRGVACGRRHRRVTVLDLSSLGVAGTLSPSIGNLSFLHKLNLSNNNLGGQLPPKLGLLSRLLTLDGSNNSFIGPIPANLSHCANLVLLFMTRNKLSGTIPTQLGLLSKLEYLQFYHNLLTGDIGFVGNLTSLVKISLSTNAFSGTIPDTLGRLQHLTYLLISVNHLSGPLPPSFYNLSSLVVLNVAQNMFEGSLHQDIGLMLPRLEVALFYSNHFSGMLPSTLSNLSEVQLLQLGNNSFSGKIAINGEKLPKLSSLLLGYSNLGLGESDDLIFLDSLVNCSKLKTLELNSNNLGGELPSSLSNLTTLSVFAVSYNHIWGSIPSGFTKLVKLSNLNLGTNQFTGAIPDDIGSLNQLIFAGFELNKFEGNIPPSFGNLSMLNLLALDNNRLEGHIPSTLGNCENLLELYLGGNRLTGPIPAQLFSAYSPLFLLDLIGNRLNGVLPLEVGQLKNLEDLGLSDNELSGEIPASLGSCTSLRELVMSDNNFQGSIPESLSALRSLEVLDLSVNNLTGSIPGYLSSFSLNILNLSFNSFEGEVPSDGVFANSSLVFLEGNQELCGGIAELQLPKCTLKGARPRKMSHRKLIMIISATCGAVGISTVLLIIVHVMMKKGNDLASAVSPYPLQQFLKLSYEMLLKATDEFSPANLIGIGSFGSVYKGVITTSDATELPIAVKVLNLQRRGSSKSFIAECKALTRIRHRNLVKIISACSSIDFKGNDFKALIYEFISNGSLDQWLYPGKGTEYQHDRSQRFGLIHRVNVAIDMASVLNYLHNGCVAAIIHCDVKPSNILLDDDMVAHLADFGLSRLVADSGGPNGSSSTIVKGTVGYAAPEYGLGSRASTQGDVYSFGIVLLELMIRKSPVDSMFDNGLNLHKLAEMALLDLDSMPNFVDASLIEAENGAANDWYRVDPGVEKCRRMACIASILKIGVACSMESPDVRANIDEAVRELKLAKDVLLGVGAS